MSRVNKIIFFLFLASILRASLISLSNAGVTDNVYIYFNGSDFANYDEKLFLLVDVH